jgi:hypothetical protein
MPFDRMIEMLRAANMPRRNFPATIVYNEGWLLRVVLDWFSCNRSASHKFTFAPNAVWFSEALLPSQFSPRQKTDSLAEGWTHADGVFGHVLIGDAALADTQVAKDATQFIVVEAKLFSPLSPGVRNAAYFDQASRNVACIAEVLSRAPLLPERLTALGFYVIAPSEQIDKNVFKRELTNEHMRETIYRRVAAYTSAERINGLTIGFCRH